MKRLVSFPIEDCYPRGCAAPGEVPCQCNTRGSPSKLKRTPPQAKIRVTSKSPVGDISVVTLIRTDTTLDHSQEAEKVWQLHTRSNIFKPKSCCQLLATECSTSGGVDHFALGRYWDISDKGSYLFGLLAMIKCSICSYQCDN